jgi:hypothetical protein
MSLRPLLLRDCEAVNTIQNITPNLAVSPASAPIRRGAC